MQEHSMLACSSSQPAGSHAMLAQGCLNFATCLRQLLEAMPHSATVVRQLCYQAIHDSLWAPTPKTVVLRWCGSGLFALA